MHEVIVCEKPTSAEKIAKALSPSAKKKVYNKKVKYWELKKDSKDITVVSAVGHLYSLTPDNPKDKVYFMKVVYRVQHHSPPDTSANESRRKYLLLRRR